MKDILKEICKAQKWGFTYGRDDFLNLYDGVDDRSKIIMFLDPLSFTDDLNVRSITESRNHQVKFLLSVSSDFDEPDYEVRYDKYIKPLVTPALELIKNTFKCSIDYTITSLSAVEVINSGDFNVDGLAVTSVIRQDVNE